MTETRPLTPDDRAQIVEDFIADMTERGDALMLAGLLNTVIKDVGTLESLPLGSVVVSGGISAYQRIIDGDWYCARSRNGVSSQRLVRQGLVQLVWLPPEATAPLEPLVHGMHGGHYERIDGGEVYVAACGTVGASPLTGLWGSITCDGCVEALS